MKYLKILILISLYLITGCSKDKAPEVFNADEIMVNINISNNFTKTAVSSRDEQYLFDGEYKINRVRIIAFDGDVMDKNIYETVQDATESVSVEMNIKAIKNKFIYVIVNEPTGLKEVLDNLTNKSELQSLEYKIAAYFTEGNSAFSYNSTQNTNLGFSSLPMSGFATINPVYGRVYPIIAYRTLARVDVWLRGASNNFSLTAESSLKYNTGAKGNYFDYKVTPIPSLDIAEKFVYAQAMTINPKTQSDEIGTAGGYQRIFTYYTPERDSRGVDNRLRFTILGIAHGVSTMNSTEVVFDENVVKRNNVYRAYCTVNPSGEVSFDYLVTAWDEETINIPTFE